MKITAKVVPYSSVVGSSITLHAESGMTICQLSLLSVIPPNFKFTPEFHKQTSVRIAEWVASALNGAAEFDPASALENGPAGLADAKNDPADSDLSSLREGDGTTYPRLSSLRKDAVGPAVSEGDRGHGAPVTSGAEVAVKQIDWRDMTYKGVEEWVGHCALSQSFTIKDEGEDRLPYRFTVRPFLSGVTSFPTADEAKAAAQSDFETRIRSALVSGSREDGDG